ncbi:MAG: EscU/YscU/HrcU family type III secretion system export apparatus switch protein [Proteobacteria bacterium]|nr:EscU/YscU/HrcU family type III secretion system export apparatus switch protein [Pseudomonadota bacterium]
MSDQEKTPPPTEAVALSYQKDDLPRVIAKGKGLTAQKIIDIAKQAEIPIHQDAVLSNTLSQLTLNQPIPKELFMAVAQVLVFAYSLTGKSPTATTEHDKNASK